MNKSQKIINTQRDIELGQFTQEELDSVQRKIRNRKTARLDEIPQEVWKTREFDDILHRYFSAVYKKCDLEIARNYRSITFTSIAAKINHALLRNCIEPKIEKILKKN